MLLKNLIKNSPENLKNFNVKGLALNSQKVKKGFIFFAIKGTRFNGEDYISEAIKNGAIIIVVSSKCKFKTNKINIIKKKNVKDYLDKIVSKFYRLKPKNIVAVTGTNGKTSVADYFYQILSTHKIPVASIGTLGIKIKNKLINSSLTSPDIISLHKNLEDLKKKKIDNVVIEASSHGLTQGRLNYINFKIGIFTNFSQDHLDYHKTMKSYLNAKLKLFSKLIPKKSYVISDQSIKQYSIIKNLSKNKKFKLLNITKKTEEINNYQSSIKNTFQSKNFAMAILAAEICSGKKIKVKSIIRKLKSVAGRLELVKEYSNNVKVFVDYAHTPDALQKAISSLKIKYNNPISLVFGCGGERDFKKRPLMAKVAKSNCAKIFVTDDNPRNENPKKIRKEIIRYLKGVNYYNISKRSKAIKEAIIKAKPNEIVLIAGKGHEKLQDYGKKIIYGTDKQIIRKIKINKNHFDQKRQNFLNNSKILNQVLKKKKIFKFNGLSIDSRQLKKHNLFLTMKGKHSDGNEFISKALTKGASYFVTSKNIKRFKKKMIKVKSTRKFLHKFSSLKRNNCNAQVVGVTGSAGKTSLKNILKTLLQKFGKTYASPKSFNNHLGVPISLSNIDFDHKYCVFEIGMNKPKEIYRLSKKIKPNIAVITNIAEAHIENFKNIKGIAKAKAEIIENVQKDGTIILNRDDRFFKYLKKIAIKKKINIISFGKSYNSVVRLIKFQRFKHFNLVTISIKNEIFKIKIKDLNHYNVLASLSVLEAFKLDIKKIINNFQYFEPSEGRGKIHNIKRYSKNFILIDESYNANPLSAQNALKKFSSIKKKNSKKYLILGDMLELGKNSEFYHKTLSKVINNSDIDKVFIKGEKSLFTFKNLSKNKRGNILQSNQDVDLILKNIIANNDYLMIKGSNATGLNNISNKMIKGN